MKKHLIIICGLPGAGKTSLVKSLKLKTFESLKGYKYLDLDKKILELNPSYVDLAELINDKGFQQFRDIESQQLKNIVNSQEKLVISIGGGALSQEHFELLKERAILIELNISIDESIKRTSKDSSRPLSKGNSRVQLENIFAKRKNILSKAHFQINGDLPLEQQVEEFIKKIDAMG
jgi:shikimate kinase